MKNKLSDQDVLNLLSSLKNAESNYPSDMIQSRRDMYVKQAAAMTMLAAGGKGATTSSSNQAAVSSTTSGGFSVGTFLEVALIVALVVEAAVATYIYRDEIADFISSTLAPKVEVVASPPGGSPSSLDIPAIEETFTEVTPVMITATGTPTPSIAPPPAAGTGNVNDTNNDEGNAQVQITSTPNPNDDSGLHLGQTKQPTKDPNTDKKDTNGGGNTDNSDTKDKEKKK